MTAPRNYWKLREEACFDFLESMKHAIRMSTLDHFKEIFHDVIKSEKICK